MWHVFTSAAIPGKVTSGCIVPCPSEAREQPRRNALRRLIFAARPDPAWGKVSWWWKSTTRPRLLGELRPVGGTATIVVRWRLTRWRDASGPNGVGDVTVEHQDARRLGDRASPLAYYWPDAGSDTPPADNGRHAMSRLHARRAGTSIESSRRGHVRPRPRRLLLERFEDRMLLHGAAWMPSCPRRKPRKPKASRPL